MYHKRIIPFNCMIYMNKHIKISNFSHAKFFGNLESGNVISSLAGQNSAHCEIEALNYMPPEYVEQGIESPAMDLWSLGCLIYHMLTGKVPFEGETRQEVENRIISKDLQWDDTPVSANARDIVEKLMQMQPELRLGAGSDGSPQSFDNLIGHPWFSQFTSRKDITVHEFYQQEIPLIFEPTPIYVNGAL